MAPQHKKRMRLRQIPRHASVSHPARLLLDSQTFSALGAPPLQHLATTLRPGPHQKTVGSSSPHLAGLIGSLHGFHLLLLLPRFPSLEKSGISIYILFAYTIELMGPLEPRREGPSPSPTAQQRGKKRSFPENRAPILSQGIKYLYYSD